MTKKHFQALAVAFKVERPGTNWNANKRVQWELDRNAVADACARFNPNFDRARFIAATEE